MGVLNATLLICEKMIKLFVIHIVSNQTSDFRVIKWEGGYNKSFFFVSKKE